jgi:hypothetical protein
LPEREIMTGVGPVAVRCPRVRDRAGEGPERIRFSSAILPPCARRSKSLEVRSRSSLGVLMLRCPTTGRGFVTGVNTDEAMFRRLPDTLSTAQHHRRLRLVAGCEDPRIDGVRRNGDEISTAVGSMLFAGKEKRGGMGEPVLRSLNSILAEASGS